jgi:hypothetical protein
MSQSRPSSNGGTARPGACRRYPRSPKTRSCPECRAPERAPAPPSAGTTPPATLDLLGWRGTGRTGGCSPCPCRAVQPWGCWNPCPARHQGRARQAAPTSIIRAARHWRRGGTARPGALSRPRTRRISPQAALRSCSMAYRAPPPRHVPRSASTTPVARRRISSSSGTAEHGVSSRRRAPPTSRTGAGHMVHLRAVHRGRRLHGEHTPPSDLGHSQLNRPARQGGRGCAHAPDPEAITRRKRPARSHPHLRPPLSRLFHWRRGPA